MINALVVDDEKLARQGFIGLIDWAAYGIRIVGEAKDGYSALSQLEKLNIDLMFVDITMPGISGFELMRRVQRRYPSMKFVILTCHHEFDYVREAMRIGAIDYIVKTLLNKSNADETMERIRKRISREAVHAASEKALFQGAAACIGRRDPVTDGSGPLGAAFGNFTALKPGLWVSMCEEPEMPDWMETLQKQVTAKRIVYIAPSGRCFKKDAEEIVRDYLPRYLFYIPDDGGVVAIRLEELDKLRQSDSEARAAEVLQEWSRMKWLLFGREWKRLIDKLQDSRLEPSRLIDMVKQLAESWSLYMEWDAEEKSRFQVTEELHSWRQVELKLSDLTLAVQRRAADVSLSRDVAVCLLQALSLMKEQACQDLHQADVARQVGMSRSYFSQCFKRFTGISFAEMLRSMRIHHAESLLEESSLSVSEIAGRAGFGDHKHFSRTFRGIVGLYPAEYRSLRQESEGNGT